MPFIRTQKIVYDEQHRIVSGSASIVDVKYVPSQGRAHSKQTVRESLGAVVLLESKRKGIFLSKTRGLVEYDADMDAFTPVEADDERLTDSRITFTPSVHVVFGDVYGLLHFLHKSGFLSILQTVFPDKLQYERLLAHTLHGVLKDGSRISCDDFIAKSVASFLIPEVPLISLKSDSVFFGFMGADEAKMKFFKAYVSAMRENNPKFGRGCYVDSTPLPNDISDNPFNALCSHGLKGCSIQMRLVLILDELTGLPVWYDIIPGNLLDVSTVRTVFDKVAAALDIEVDSLVVDAGYVSKEMIGMCHIGTEKSMIGRMPNRKGFPFEELYNLNQDFMAHHDHDFRSRGHDYFGVRREIKLFGFKTYAYVYVDRQNAMKAYGDFHDAHPDEFSSLSGRERDWQAIRGGYFILVSNRELPPNELLDEYFGRTEIEGVFKTAKTYLDLLPLRKWTDQTVRGKILSDIINTIVVLSLRKRLAETGISLTELFGKTQSLMCMRDKKNNLIIETPNKNVRQLFKVAYELKAPARLDLNAYRSQIVPGV